MCGVETKSSQQKKVSSVIYASNGNMSTASEGVIGPTRQYMKRW